MKQEKQEKEERERRRRSGEKKKQKELKEGWDSSRNHQPRLKESLQKLVPSRRFMYFYLYHLAKRKVYGFVSSHEVPEDIMLKIRYNTHSFDNEYNNRVFKYTSQLLVTESPSGCISFLNSFKWIYYT